MTKLSVTLTSRERNWGFGWFAFQLLALPSLLRMLPLDILTLNLLGFTLNFLAVIGLFGPFLWKNARIFFAHPGQLLLVCLVVYFANQFITFALSSVITELFPGFSNVNDANIGQMAKTSYWPMFIATVILVPVAEEMCFRGLIFGSLHAKSRLLAYGVSALAFALPHVMGYMGRHDIGILLLCLIQYLPAGILLAYAYEKADSLWAPIFVHSAVNAIAMLAVRL
ncbi:MAG: CPBP family intramembrane metalloprotease [Ruminococcaceae bacterium]|nr:CPBP family intramembrane metalloprotease [Oscillospiraceae bacterium]